MTIAFLNNEFVPLEEARISPMDRGFLFGDGIYEVIPSYGGRLIGLDLHLARLENGLGEIGIDIPWSGAQLTNIFRELIDKNGNGNLGIYLQITRGVTMKRNHAFPANTTPTLFGYTFAIPAPITGDPEKVTHWKVTTRQDLRWQRCHSTRAARAHNGKTKTKTKRRRSAIQIELDLTLADNGLCCALKGKDDATLDVRLSLTELGKRLDLARITWNDDPIYQPRTPVIRLGDALVSLPPNPFLQPSVEGQTVLQTWVLEGVPSQANLVADLYSGMGTFSFPLAERQHDVLAVEGNEEAILAMESARRQDERYAKLSGAVRDLDRWAISAEDLNGFDAVVFDPPRAGANNQSRALAQSNVPVVIAVSCNPATFSRDAKHLIDGGYRLIWTRCLDQFPWTGHVEIVAKFER